MVFPHTRVRNVSIGRLLGISYFQHVKKSKSKIDFYKKVQFEALKEKVAKRKSGRLCLRITYPWYSLIPTKINLLVNYYSNINSICLYNSKDKSISIYSLKIMLNYSTKDGCKQSAKCRSRKLKWRGAGFPTLVLPLYSVCAALLMNLFSETQSGLVRVWKLFIWECKAFSIHFLPVKENISFIIFLQ